MIRGVACENANLHNINAPFKHYIIVFYNFFTVFIKRPCLFNKDKHIMIEIFQSDDSSQTKPQPW